MRVTDYIADLLTQKGIVQAYMVTGGGAMHLNDSLSFHPDMHVTYNHHEQACAIAAEGYFRSSGRVACVNVTTGPGGLNTLTGVMGQWTDSIPAVYISGQVKFETTVASCREIPLRQLGDQEVDIVSVVRPLVKYATQIREPAIAGYELEKAIWIATHGRPGPVWVDIPMNVQGAETAKSDQHHFVADADGRPLGPDIVRAAVERLRNAQRPVVVAGHGVRLSGALGELRFFVERLGIPLLTTFNGMDLVEDEYPFHVGRIGTLGSRGGNFALQNADLALFLGTRNNIRQVSYNWESFARRAYKIVVDIDEAELNKPTIRPDMSILADVREFLALASDLMRAGESAKFSKWFQWCLERKRKYPDVLDEYRHRKDGVHPYVFMERLAELIPRPCTVVSANGTASIALFQAGKVQRGHRYICNSGTAAMGYDLPAAIGAADGTGGVVVCLAGDGSLQMNLQELGTIAHHGYPIKIFYFNNRGYSSIKQTQDGFFGRRAGCDRKTGVGLPNIEPIAAAYEIPCFRVHDLGKDERAIVDTLATKGPALCNVVLTEDYVFAPRVSSRKMPDGKIVSAPLEDLFPFLSRDELMSNMIES